MSSLLIIGGSGFVGKSFIDYFLNKRKNYGIKDLIIISRKKIDIVKNKNKIRFFHIRKNFLKLKNLPNTNHILYCINSKSLRNDIDCFNHFKFILKKSKKKPFIIFTSSGSVYGPINKRIKSNERDEIGKNFHKYLNYKKDYSFKKILLEEKFNELSLNGFKVCIVRLFTFSGIYIDKNEALPNLITQGLKNKKIFIKSNSHIYRSYMSDKLLVKLLLILFKKIKTNYSVFNIGSDDAISIENLGKMISKVFKKGIYKPKFKTKKMDYYIPSIKKLKKISKINIRSNVTKDIKIMISYFKKIYLK